MGKLEDRLQVVMNRLDEHSGDIVYDCETSGLRWQRNHICGHVLSFGPKPADSFYLPVRHAGGGNVGGHVGPPDAEGWDGKLAKWEKPLLDKLFRQGRVIGGHNLSFDAKFVFRLIGTQAFEPQFWDTQINEPLIDEFGGKFSLEACCLRRKVQPKLAAPMYAHLRAKFPEIKSDREAMGHFWRLAGDDTMATEYAEGDGTSTWQLNLAQLVEIRKPVEFRRVNGEPVYTDLTKVHDIESRLIRVLARMTCKGIKVDVGYFEQLRASLNEQIEQAMQVFPDPDSASVQAPTDVKWYMEKHGVCDWPMTPKTKRPSFPEAWLEKSEPGREIIKIRRLVHMRNSFINPLLEEHIWNGRVHTNFNQLRNDQYGTITGRLSCDSPNLQQAHKRNETAGRMLRGGFVPDKGMIFSDVDYSQIEPRILAHYSRCKVLMDGYLAKPAVDAHLAVAMAINASKWDKMGDAERKDARQTGKRVNQTVISGGGKGVLVDRYGVDKNEVNKIWNDYFKSMPEIRTLQKQAASRMEKRGFVVSLLGRRQRLLDRSKAYIAVNRLLQSTNADLLKDRLVAIDDYLESEGRPNVDVLLNIHDSMLFQFDKNSRPVYNKCLEIMQDVITGYIQLDVPAEIEAGEGKTWAEATFGEEK